MIHAEDYEVMVLVLSARIGKMAGWNPSWGYGALAGIDVRSICMTVKGALSLV